MESSVKSNTPCKIAKNKDGYPWINIDLKRLINRRDSAYKRKKKSGNMADKERYMYQTLKQETQRQLRKAYWQYVEGIVTPKADSTSEHGNCMKRFRSGHTSNTKELITTPPHLFILNKQFQMAFSSKSEITR